MNNKPIVITRQEFISDLEKLVNETPLPAFVMRDVLHDLDKVLAVKEQQEYQLALSITQGEEKQNDE